MENTENLCPCCWQPIQDDLVEFWDTRGTMMKKRIARVSWKSENEYIAKCCDKHATGKTVEDATRKLRDTHFKKGW